MNKKQRIKELESRCAFLESQITILLATRPVVPTPTGPRWPEPGTSPDTNPAPSLGARGPGNTVHPFPLIQ